MEELPLYQITIDKDYQSGEEELGMDQIAFTSDPAIIVKGVAFKSAQRPVAFSDNKKYRITAPVMIPMDIYRYDDEMGEYEVRFTAEEIEKIFVKFMQDVHNRDLFNLEHEEGNNVPAFVLEAWTVDNPKEDKAYSTFGLEVPKGTLMMTAQLTDKDYYNTLVSEDRIGFSMEGFLGLKVPEEFRKQFNSNKMTEEEKEVTPVEEVAEATVEASEETQETPVEVEAATEEEEVEVKAEKDEEEELMEEPKEEEELAVDPEVDAEAILNVVMPALEAMRDEVLNAVAEMLKEKEETEAPVEEAEEVAGFKSAAQMLHNYRKFTKNG